MKVALISNYPIADNAKWKRELALKLRHQNIELVIIYGRSSFLAHINSFFFRRKFRQKIYTPYSSKKFAKVDKKNFIQKIYNNYLFFRNNNFKTFTFLNINSDKAIATLKSLECDYYITALDQILSKKFVEAIPNILNIHYGKLPDIKGTSSSEWTLFETGELYITLHFIDNGIDTGEIVQVKKIDLKDFDFNAVRMQIQKVIPDMYIKFIKEPKTASNKSSDNRGGKLYTYMHRDIKKILFDKLNHR